MQKFEDSKLKLVVILHSFILSTSKKNGTMEYVYAALMLHKLKKEITEENVTSIVKASGTEVNEAKVKSLVASLADVDIEDAIKAAPVAAAAPAAAAPAAEGGEGKKAEKKDEAADGKKEEAAMEGLSSLFG